MIPHLLQVNPTLRQRKKRNKKANPQRVATGVRKNQRKKTKTTTARKRTTKTKTKRINTKQRKSKSKKATNAVGAMTKRRDIIDDIP